MPKPHAARIDSMMKQLTQRLSRPLLGKKGNTQAERAAQDWQAETKQLKKKTRLYASKTIQRRRTK